MSGFYHSGQSSELQAGSRVEQARGLPGPKPGVAVTVPLELLPLYLEIHGLEPDGFFPPEVVRVRRGGAVVSGQGSAFSHQRAAGSNWVFRPQNGG